MSDNSEKKVIPVDYDELGLYEEDLIVVPDKSKIEVKDTTTGQVLNMGDGSIHVPGKLLGDMNHIMFEQLCDTSIDGVKYLTVTKVMERIFGVRTEDTRIHRLVYRCMRSEDECTYVRIKHKSIADKVDVEIYYSECELPNLIASIKGRIHLIKTTFTNK
jgi:hypothetical protein